MNASTLENVLLIACQARSGLIDLPHRSAFRLFSGYYEGDPDLVADLYAATLLLTSNNASGAESQTLLDFAQQFYLQTFPWIECVVQKQDCMCSPRLLSSAGLACTRVIIFYGPVRREAEMN